MPDQIDILTLDRHWTDGAKLSRFFHLKHNDISSKYRELKQREAKLGLNYLDMHGRLFRNNGLTDVLMFDLRSTASKLTESWENLKSELSDVSTGVAVALIGDLRSGEYIAFAKNGEPTGSTIDVTADLMDSFGTFSTLFDFDRSIISEEKIMGRKLCDVVVFDRNQYRSLRSAIEADLSVMQTKDAARSTGSGGRSHIYDWDGALDAFFSSHLKDAEFESAAHLIREMQKAFTTSGQREPDESYVRKELNRRFPKLYERAKPQKP